MGTSLILKMTLCLQGWMQEWFALSYHEEIHAFILEYMYTICLKAFVYSFKTFYKLEKKQQQQSVFCFMSNYKYEKIVCNVCILYQFPGSMTCNTFKSIPIQKKKKISGVNRSRPKRKGFERHRKNCHRCKKSSYF